MLVDNTDQIINRYRETLKNALHVCGIVGKATIQSDSPILTGNLKRSYAFRVFVNAKTFVLVFGTNIPYAVYVEMKPESRGGRPHLRRAVEGELDEFNRIIMNELQAVGK